MLVIQLEKKQTKKTKQELYIADMPWFITLLNYMIKGVLNLQGCKDELQKFHWPHISFIVFCLLLRT